MAINFGNNQGGPQTQNIWQQIMANSGVQAPQTQQVQQPGGMRDLGGMLGKLLLPNKGANIGSNFNKLGNFLLPNKGANIGSNLGNFLLPNKGANISSNLNKAGSGLKNFFLPNQGQNLSNMKNSFLDLFDRNSGVKNRIAQKVKDDVEYDPWSGQPISTDSQIDISGNANPYKNFQPNTDASGANNTRSDFDETAVGWDGLTDLLSLNEDEDNVQSGGEVTQQRKYYHPWTGQEVSKDYYDAVLSNKEPTGTVFQQLQKKYSEPTFKKWTDEELLEKAKIDFENKQADEYYQNWADEEQKLEDESVQKIENYEAQPEFQGPPLPPDVALDVAPVVDAFQNRFEAGDEFSATPGAEDAGDQMRFEADDMKAMEEIRNQELSDFANNPFNRNNPMYQNLLDPDGQSFDETDPNAGIGSAVNNLIGGGPAPINALESDANIKGGETSAIDEALKSGNISNVSFKDMYNRLGPEGFAKVIARMENPTENPWEFSGDWNNPGNIRSTKTGEFMRYPNMNAGRNALLSQLGLYASGKSKSGIMPDTSMFDFIGKYAADSPENEQTAYLDMFLDAARRG